MGNLKGNGWALNILAWKLRIYNGSLLHLGSAQSLRSGLQMRRAHILKCCGWHRPGPCRPLSSQHPFDGFNFLPQLFFFHFEFFVLIHQSDQLFIKGVNFNEFPRSFTPPIDAFFTPSLLYSGFVRRTILFRIRRININGSSPEQTGSGYGAQLLFNEGLVDLLWGAPRR